MNLERVLTRLEDWFAHRGWAPFPFQRQVWQAYLAGESGLIHATTGAGKTYAAWLGPVAEWLAFEAASGTPALRVLWITPLRALAADTVEALRAPLEDLGVPWQVETRTGDTSAAARARQRRHLPTALITTPESLSLLLTQPEWRHLFADLRLVVVDEWHELLSTKRGVQVELALARLRRLHPDLRVWGLSATMGNLDVALDALIPGLERQSPRGGIVRGHISKPVVIETLLPDTIERFPWAGHLGLKLLPQVVATIEQSETSLVFTNTRAQAEIWYQALLDARPEWAGTLALHHGSLDREVREWVENALRDRRLRCVVCTSSLDLGVDFSPVDQVIQIGSPKGVARLLQRAGRSGHRPGAVSKVTCAPASALELIDIAAARDAIAQEQIEARIPLESPLDVLVQHLVTCALGGGFVADELLAEVRSTRAFRRLSDNEWQWALDFVVRGGTSLRAYPEFHRIVEREGRYVVENEAVARRHRVNIGTIVSETALKVQYVRGGTLGTVEESFAARLKPGEVFFFAGKALEFVQLRDMTVFVRKAERRDGVTPRWFGGRMPLSTELSRAIRARIAEARDGVFRGAEMEAVRPLLELQARWSLLPSADELLIERVQTREGYHLFIYPFEGRLVHEGMAALIAFRLSRLRPITFTLAMNDYGFELLAPDPAPLTAALDVTLDDAGGRRQWSIAGANVPLFSAERLVEDILASLNATEMAKRQFREIARIAGLVYEGYPGEKSARQVQASSSLMYDVFAQYDPEHRLLEQARCEVLERQLEQSRLAEALARIAAGQIIVVDVPRPTPFAFPLLVDRLRERLSSEKLADRVRKMQLTLEREADAGQQESQARKRDRQ
ncbi:ligase-associated DNA damage response DEXH box helicase [Roseiflexus sp.]|uniref:ligase-associated DNA damage response DEXH box helicase n=1 Tax=Roseiflexus sp. TaxID=2562120 RepID=UPI00398B1AEB